MARQPAKKTPPKRKAAPRKPAVEWKPDGPQMDIGGAKAYLYPPPEENPKKPAAPRKKPVTPAAKKIDKRIGNQYWRSRSSHGRNPIFKSPEQLMSACEEYFDYVEDNPLKSAKPHVVDGKIVYSETAVMRAMTIKDLCRFLDVTLQTWLNYKSHEDAKGNKDFLDIVTRVEDIIYTQKLTGAAGGMLNANIIARDLGLKEQSEVTGAGGGPVVHEHRTWRQVLREEKEKTEDEQA